MAWHVTVWYATQSPDDYASSRKSIKLVSHVNAMTDDDCSRHSSESRGSREEAP